jgi:hypothetical protein
LTTQFVVGAAAMQQTELAARGTAWQMIDRDPREAFMSRYESAAGFAMRSSTPRRRSSRRVAVYVEAWARVATGAVGRAFTRHEGRAPKASASNAACDKN